MKGIKHIETLKLTFKKTTVDTDKNEPKMIFKTTYFNSKAKTIINENEINESNMNDVCRFSRDHVVECSERTVLSCLDTQVRH